MLSLPGRLTTWRRPRTRPRWCPHTLADIDVNDALEGDRLQLKMEENHSNDTSVFKPYLDKELKDRNFLELREEVVKKISKIRHPSGVPIGVPLRTLLIPKPHRDDAEANYLIHDEEVIARMQLIRTDFVDNEDLDSNKARTWTTLAIDVNGRCFDYLSLLFSTTRYWNHVGKQILARRDGRGAINCITINICGDDAQEEQYRANRETWSKLVYTGETQRRGFLKYVEENRECIRIQEGLHLTNKEKYPLFREEEKVNNLTRGYLSRHASAGVASIAG